MAYTKPNRKGGCCPAGPVPRAGSSDAATFPGAAYAPYADRSHKWNPLGSELERQRVDVPVMLLDEGRAAADAARRAADNALQVPCLLRIRDGYAVMIQFGSMLHWVAAYNDKGLLGRHGC